MKKKVFFLIFLILLFIGFVSFRYFILDNQNTFGRVKVVSSPTASVFIDNQIVGRTPFEEKYKTGEFVIKLIPEGSATDAASWQGKIKVYKNALTYVNQELGPTDINTAGEIFTTTPMETRPKNSGLGEVYIETEPNGAIVYLDNDEKGVAPLILAEVMKGDHELSVFMPGFFRRTRKINVDPEYRVNASFKLALDIAQAPQEKKPTTTPGVSPIPSSQKSSILIKDTPLGYLRVREEPSTAASESGQVKPGEKYDLLEEKTDWYKIKIDTTKEGWVSAQYSEKQNQ